MMRPWVRTEFLPGIGYVAVCDACGARQAIQTQEGVFAFGEAHSAHQSAARGYYGAGDAVHAVAQRAGIESCTPCEKRRRAMNSWLPRLWRH